MSAKTTNKKGASKSIPGGSKRRDVSDIRARLAAQLAEKKQQKARKEPAAPAAAPAPIPAATPPPPTPAKNAQPVTIPVRVHVENGKVHATLRCSSDAPWEAINERADAVVKRIQQEMASDLSEAEAPVATPPLASAPAGSGESQEAATATATTTKVVDGKILYKTVVTDDSQEADWLRGFCATMGKTMYSIQDSLKSVCMAMGLISTYQIANKRRTSPLDIDSVLEAAQRVMERGLRKVDGEQEQMELMGRLLLVLSPADVTSLTGDAVWVLCRLLLFAAPYCRQPSRLAPLAIQWVRHAWIAGLHDEYLKASALTAAYFTGRGRPEEAVHIIKTALEHDRKHPATAREWIATLYLYHAQALQTMGKWAEALDVVFEFALLDMAAPTLPASLLVDIYDCGALSCRRLDDAKVEKWCLDNVQQVLTRVEPAFDADPSALDFFAHRYTCDMVFLLARLKYFDRALICLSEVPLEFAVLWAKDKSLDLDAFKAEMVSYVFRDRRYVDMHCEWSMCAYCCEMSKDMLICPCTTAWYCDAQCQLEHWPLHEKHCAMCWGCGARGSYYNHCSRCNVVRFCSQQCLNDSWPRHKPDCIPHGVERPRPEEKVEPVPVGEADISTEEEQVEQVEQVVENESAWERVMEAEGPTMNQLMIAQAAMDAADFACELDHHDFWFSRLEGMLGLGDKEK